MQTDFLSKLEMSAIQSNSDPHNYNDICQKHNHEYQAFCQNEQKLLCIDCLIEDHKRHKVWNIQDAAKKLVDKLRNAYNMQLPQEDLSADQLCLTKIQSEVTLQESQLSKIFDEIRDFVNSAE